MWNLGIISNNSASIFCKREGSFFNDEGSAYSKQYLSDGHIWPDVKVEILHVPVKKSNTSYNKIYLSLTSSPGGCNDASNYQCIAIVSVPIAIHRYQVKVSIIIAIVS